MATPTPSSGNPHKHTNSVLHNAATPQPHLAAFTSPAPRSVPSPAAQRTQAGKSPFNASTHAPSSSTMMAQNHPSGGSSASNTKGLIGSSPAGMFNFDSPNNQMGLSLSNMGGLDNFGMGISMSGGLSGFGMAGGLSSTGRGTDEERRKRLEDVVAHIKARPGRITPANVKTLGERTGMFTEISRDTKESVDTISIAGGSVLIDVKFNAMKLIETASLEYPTSSEDVQKNEKSASRILKDSLSVPQGLSHITANLERFEKHLTKLAKLDKLNGPTAEQNFNCFEAITGVYTSLRKIFEHEKKIAMALLTTSRDDEEAAEREVMCKKSGRPVMNVRNEIGLKLEYWMQRRRVRRSKRSVDPDGDHNMDGTKAPEQNSFAGADAFSLSIECEASLPTMFPSARTSNAWVSDQIEKRSNEIGEAFGPTIDWLEPSPTYLLKPNAGDSDPMELEKLPNIRFTAKFDPPLLLPLQIATQLLTTVGASQETPNSTEPVAFFDTFLSHCDDPAHVVLSKESTRREYRTERTVIAGYQEGVESYMKHSNSLFVPKPEYARYMRELPFSHPRQLVELLPILRQYAFVTSLLGNSFSLTRPSPVVPTTNKSILPVDVKLTGCTKVAVIFPRLRTPPESPQSAPPEKEISLDSLLSHRLSEKRKGPIDPIPASISVTLDIHHNGDFIVLNQNLVTHINGNALTESVGSSVGGTPAIDQEQKVIQKLQSALDVCGDLGIWVEWVRKNASKLVG
ncbi:hypothetical protein EJ08DRAFT_285945 [Tothia fuscella]|uniref:Mediator of RNA polymerase II transcription subunit 1 n=1 Tax=Tothia fuscella TaxID=1048955 RepID=A0A9P4U2F1_9PEZI|nr:hypothetical protein EJ08DRAFT_285945 [Tothia fuscella]